MNEGGLRPRTGPQGEDDITLVSSTVYVKTTAFRAGIRDYVARRPLPVFNDDWAYDDGRLFAAALLRQGVDPIKLNIAARARWYDQLRADGTLFDNGGR
jgi:hypothetical protein